MDATDVLSNTLNNLRIFQLPTPSNSTQESEQATVITSETLQGFSLYPTLPSELRLKILSHTLPPPCILRVAAHVLISDPSFGLYLTFSISTLGYRHGGGFRPVPEPGEVTSELKSTRMTTLLSVCKESREFYLSRHSLALPSGPNGKGQIRLSERETLYIDNFPGLLANPDFSRAIESNDRLQAFWTQVERLAIPVASFMRLDHETYEVLLEVVRKSTGLRVVHGVMWDSFRDGEMDERGVRSVLVGIERYLRDFGRRLGECSNSSVEGERGGTEEGRVGGERRWIPRMEILEV